MPKISIIIPVFNTATYLRQCLDSICSQTLEDIEIICVDDCSTDGSLDILKLYATRDHRFVILRQKQNGGPGAARNLGISRAKGKYVGFADSDDWVEPEYFESMFSVAESKNADIVLNTNIVRGMPNSSIPWVWLGSPDVSAEGCYIEREISANYTHPSLYAHIYRRDFLISSDCKCPVRYNIGEDKFFHIISSMCANSIFAYVGPGYHYRKNSISLTGLSSLYNVNTVRFFKDIVEYFGNKIFKKNFTLKLFNGDMFSEISSEYEFTEVKKYLEGLSDYFKESGVFFSDFDRYAIGNILRSETFEEMLKRIGKQPWVRYFSMERIKNKMNVKVSVIIPVYNTDVYIGRCLRSVCDQTLRDIEIICVNDCSTDNSLNVIKHYAVEDNRIQIIDLTQNGGVSNARNVALKQAGGPFVYFIDSDDWIDAGYLEEMLNVIETQNSDVIINSHFINEYDDSSKNTESSFPFIGTSGSAISAKELQLHYPPVIWSRLYRKTFLDKNNITFPIVKGGAEDIFFSYACDLTRGSVYAFRGKAYHYYQRPSSAMHMSNRGYHYFESFKLLYDYMTDKGLPLDGIKLFYVESLIIDTEEKYDFIKSYLSEIGAWISSSPSIYNEQEHFLVKILSETDDYTQFTSRYNPNIAISFIRNKMTNRTKLN